MKVYGVVPARGGSKGIPQKNIKLLNGRPLISYTIEAALKSDLDDVLVSTDCPEVAAVAEQHGAAVAMRDPSLALDDTPTHLVLQSLVDIIGPDYGAIMTLQPTSPLRNDKHINEALDLFVEDDNADSLVSVTRVPHNFLPEKIMRYNDAYLIGDNRPKRRQLHQEFYARNGAAIYISKMSLVTQCVFGGNILPYFMSKVASFDIDDYEDWEIVERILSSEQKSL